MEKIKIIDVVNNEYNMSGLSEKYSKSQYNIFTNFILKHISIVNRMMYLNQLIERQYKNWERLVIEPKIDNSSNLNFYLTIVKHKQWQRQLINNYFEQEELIMHIRKAVDDCISLLSISTNCLTKGKEEKIERPFEMIGELFRNNYKGFEYLKRHDEFLRKINNISNGFKHCIANNMSLKIGKNEPCIFVYENNKHSYYNEIGITINDLIVGFNDFYSTFNSKIKEK